MPTHSRTSTYVIYPWLIVLLLLSVSAVQADGKDIQSLEEIRDAVRQFVLSEHMADTDIHVEVKPLDRRLRLSPCAQPLNAFWSPGSRSLGRVTVQVECDYPRPWRVHVQSTVTLEGFVWALARGVKRGDILERDLLVRQAVKLGANNAALATYGSPVLDLKPWLGFSFSQRVAGGKVLSERMLKPALLVQKGESVLIRHELTGLKLQTKGVALKGAAMGSRVQVRNSSSGKVIDATVMGRGVVDVLH